MFRAITSIPASDSHLTSGEDNLGLVTPPPRKSNSNSLPTSLENTGLFNTPTAEHAAALARQINSPHPCRGTYKPEYPLESLLPIPPRPVPVLFSDMQSPSFFAQDTIFELSQNLPLSAICAPSRSYVSSFGTPVEDTPSKEAKPHQSPHRMGFGCVV